jgi:DNA topoisomerase-1
VGGRADSKKHVKAIADALKDDPDLILATDPDREGEAISWHLKEALEKRKAIKKDTTVRRVTFNAITKDAVTEAMAEPARGRHGTGGGLPRPPRAGLPRGLHALAGALAQAAGREIGGPRAVRGAPASSSTARWRSRRSARGILVGARGARNPARPELRGAARAMGGKKLDRFDLATEAEAGLAVKAVSSRALAVTGVEAKPATRNPAPPFMTSTLQQEASRKFGMGAKQTMSAAQRLYEAGHITYMRTDGIDMAPEAVSAARDAIAARYGEDYVPGSPRIYKNKAKNAQEAHECIRPTDMSKAPR